jgi:hypothetical protein
LEDYKMYRRPMSPSASPQHSRVATYLEAL